MSIADSGIVFLLLCSVSGLIIDACEPSGRDFLSEFKLDLELKGADGISSGF